MRPHTPTHVSSYYCTCVLILLYMCPHTAIYLLVYVSSHSYTCVFILLYMCPHTAIYVSSYCYICVLIMLYVSSHYYTGVFILLYVSSYHQENACCATERIHLLFVYRMACSRFAGVCILYNVCVCVCVCVRACVCDVCKLYRMAYSRFAGPLQARLPGSSMRTHIVGYLVVV
jgi:hypothetical protein